MEMLLPFTHARFWIEKSFLCVRFGMVIDIFTLKIGFTD
jgi:hypothetical protein